MKQPAPFPVTEDNFPQCWEYIDRLRRKSRLMCAIAKLGGFLTNLFFLFSLLLMVNGLIYSHFHGSYHWFLRSLPLFSELWEKISALLLSPGDTPVVQAGKLVACAYGASALLFIALALVIALIYHPLRKQLPEGDYEVRTAALAKAAQEAWAKAYKTNLSTSPAATLLVIIAAFVLFFAYAIQLQDALAAQALLSIFPTHDYTTNALIYVLAAYIICHILSTILLFVTRFVYHYSFPYHLMAQAETAALIAREAPGDLSPDERNQWAQERSETLRREALELEKEAAYQKAGRMLHDAALLGDVPAMEHYARHCILSHLNESARYWLEQFIASGDDIQAAKKMLLRLRLRLNHRAAYLRPDAAPLTKGQRILRALKTIFTVLIRVLTMLLFIAAVAVCVLLLTDRLEITALTDFLTKLFS